MGSHRAERPARTGLSETPQPTPYVGRRCAVRSEHAASAETTTSLPRVTASLADDVTAELPLVRSQTPGKRKAVKHAGSRGPLFRGLPSPPVLLGVATLAIAVSGVVVSGTDTTTQLTSGDRGDAQVRAAGAAGGVSAIGSVDTLRGRQTSRSASRDDGTQTDDKLIKAAEAQVEVRSEELGQLAAEVEQQAKKLADNRWVMPLTPVVLTARYGEYGLWSSYHTGLDFNGNTGDPISAIAGGVVTFVGYDGAYGNKTVVTLEDGTEIWYAHQTSQYVSIGENVAAGEVIGTVGSTGNVTGSHLHVEVRPGGGDPVDPYAAMVVNGVAF